MYVTGLESYSLPTPLPNKDIHVPSPLDHFWNCKNFLHSTGDYNIISYVWMQWTLSLYVHEELFLTILSKVPLLDVSRIDEWCCCGRRIPTLFWPHMVVKIGLNINDTLMHTVQSSSRTGVEGNWCLSLLLAWTKHTTVTMYLHPWDYVLHSESLTYWTHYSV